MQRSRLFFGALALMLAAGAAVSGAARAATITYSGAADDIFFNGGDSAFTWAQFNPSAGLLNAVTYAVNGAFTFTVSQAASFAVTPSYSVSKGFTLNGTGLRPASIFAGPFDSVLNLGWGLGPLQPGDVSTRTVALNFLRAPDFDLASFIGTGFINADLGLSEDSDLCASGTGAQVNCAQSGALTVSVTYDYTPAAGAAVGSDPVPVPEPPTYALLALGLCAALLGFGRHAAERAPNMSRRTWSS